MKTRLYGKPEAFRKGGGKAADVNDRDAAWHDLYKVKISTGERTLIGQVNPIDVDPGGALFADGAGTYQVIASLPLADGYSLTFRNFDVMKKKSLFKQLKFAGAESVTVPAGTFDAYKVEVTAADNEAEKQTIWVDKTTRSSQDLRRPAKSQRRDHDARTRPVILATDLHG